MEHIATSLRLAAVTMLVCCVLYTTVIWAVANAITPWTALGSLLENDRGEIVGSERIAQRFTRPDYFWPRPSAVDYNAAAAGGSNKSPASPELVERLRPLLEAHGAGPERPLPADLATASGSGLDPHITLEAALFQAPRVARARGLDQSALVDWLEHHAAVPGGPPGGCRIVHVLTTNLALDRGEVR